jgi:hypothetical protein
VLTLGATFDPRPVHHLLMACNLRHGDRLIERRERVLLKPRRGSSVPEAYREIGVAGALPPKLGEEFLALVTCPASSRYQASISRASHRSLQPDAIALRSSRTAASRSFSSAAPLANSS